GDGPGAEGSQPDEPGQAVAAEPGGGEGQGRGGRVAAHDDDDAVLVLRQDEPGRAAQAGRDRDLVAVLGEQGGGGRGGGRAGTLQGDRVPRVTGLGRVLAGEEQGRDAAVRVEGVGELPEDDHAGGRVGGEDGGRTGRGEAGGEQAGGGARAAQIHDA